VKNPLEDFFEKDKKKEQEKHRDIYFTGSVVEEHHDDLISL